MSKQLVGRITAPKLLTARIDRGTGMGELPQAKGLSQFPMPAYAANGTDLTAVQAAIAEKAGVEKPAFPDGFVEGVEVMGDTLEAIESLTGGEAPLKNQLQADIAAANEVTGKEDATVHDAVASLIEGFGQGSGVNEPAWELIEDRTVESETSRVHFVIPDCYEVLVIYSAATAKDGAFNFKINNDSSRPVANPGWAVAGTKKGFCYISDFIAGFPLMEDYSPVSGIACNSHTAGADLEIPEFPPTGMGGGYFTVLTNEYAPMPLTALDIDGPTWRVGSRFAVYGRRTAEAATEADYIAALNELGVEV